LTILSNGDIASGASDRTILVWNSTSGIVRVNTTNNPASISSLTHLQSNDDIVSGRSGDFKINVWNSTDGALKLSFIDHTGRITSLATLSNEDIVSASADATIRV
jgi:WD40 repeat protein